MKGIVTTKSELRKTIFKEVANLAYTNGGAKELSLLPYKIVPNDIANFRDTLFNERAIVSDRLRAAMGLKVHPVARDRHLSSADDFDKCDIDEKYIDGPLVNVITYACHGCAEKRVIVTNGCQGCFEHPCKEVCPKKAISMVDGKSHIDQSLCVKCGRCADVCQYRAIIKQDRPCLRVCGVKAIENDEYGRARINKDKCVSCGQCMVTCPFGAIVDKGQIYQTIKATQSGPVIAIVAPAIAGQFAGLNGHNIVPLFKKLGFSDVYDVAVGADLCTIEEGSDFLNEVPGKHAWMGTSCCPAWAQMIRNEFKDLADNVSMALTPMVLTARLVKDIHPEAKICFVGPCTAKKFEASRTEIKSYVDFVLTFEELGGMMAAKDIKIEELEYSEDEKVIFNRSSADGKGFAAAGGVAQAVVNFAKDTAGVDVNVVNATGLEDCKKMLMLAKVHRYDGMLLEGMACPGGCITGPGTIASEQLGKMRLKETQTKDSTFTGAKDTIFKDKLDELVQFKLSGNE